MRRRALVLSGEQREELVVVRDRDRRPYLRERAAALRSARRGLALANKASQSRLAPAELGARPR